jgi:hypothetical protein
MLTDADRLQVVAIDWSGAMRGAPKKIWFARADAGGLVTLENGRDREQIGDHLIAMAAHDPRMVVGLDFAFSFPAWFLLENGYDSAQALWRQSIVLGEEWLSCAATPFWGRPGRKRPSLLEHYRRTELVAPAVAGIRAKSVFQVFGAGAVGTGSIRGMPLLARLSEVGFAVWPFDVPTFPLLVEIYPRLLTDAVRKGSQPHREAYLARHYPNLAAELASRAASSEDAFDAAVSALVMHSNQSSLLKLRQCTDEPRRLEGAIWFPTSPQP